MAKDALTARIDALDWPELAAQLSRQGYAHTPRVLCPRECKALTALYDDDARFRTRIDMARYRFGEGDYGYFAHPLPPLVAELREGLYRRLAPIANTMMREMRMDLRYPARLETYLKACHAAGQLRPTPLLLHYVAGGYNCLHRDLYGKLLFPLQAVAMLSRPGADYTGGEFLLVENRPRQQARGEAIRAEQGQLLIFPVHERPGPGKRGMLRAAMRHGASRIHSGERYALGIIFHDAE